MVLTQGEQLAQAQASRSRRAGSGRAIASRWRRPSRGPAPVLRWGVRQIALRQPRHLAGVGLGQTIGDRCGENGPEQAVGTWRLSVPRRRSISS